MAFYEYGLYGEKLMCKIKTDENMHSRTDHFDCTNNVHVLTYFIFENLL